MVAQNYMQSFKEIQAIKKKLLLIQTNALNKFELPNSLNTGVHYILSYHIINWLSKKKVTIYNFFLSIGQKNIAGGGVYSAPHRQRDSWKQLKKILRLGKQIYPSL